MNIRITPCPLSEHNITEIKMGCKKKMWRICCSTTARTKKKYQRNRDSLRLIIKNKLTKSVGLKNKLPKCM